MRHSRGFTLIELMVTLALVAISVSLAAPSFRSTIQNNRAASQANEFASAISLARSTASHRGGINVFVSSLSGDFQWEGGYRVWADTNGNGNFVASEDEELRVFGELTGGVTLTGSVSQLRFNSAGFLNESVIANATFQLRAPDCIGSADRNFIVSPAGRINVTRVPC